MEDLELVWSQFHFVNKLKKMKILVNYYHEDILYVDISIQN